MPVTLDELVVELAARERERFYGKYRGIVRDTDDPERVGRLRAQVPAVLGDADSPWALPCTPYAGPGEGLYAIPPVGAAVWIEFEGGDPSRPIWSGGWWGQGERPQTEQGREADPPQKVLRSASGLLLALDDDGHTATLSDAHGSNLLKISVDSGEIRVQCTAKVIVEAPQIELTEGATHPLVFGDDLLQYLNQLVTVFNTHLHIGETVIGVPVTPIVPATPFPPATPALLSLRVKTG
jgi:hypothetical protein